MEFMGIIGRHLEMLFISNEERGKGLRRKLLQYGIEKYVINDVTVNEKIFLQKVSMNIWDSKFIKKIKIIKNNRGIPLIIIRMETKVSLGYQL